MYTESARRRSWLLAAALGLIALLAATMGLRTTSADHVPDPIDPDSGEANLLGLINSLPLNSVQQALDNFPVPYVVVATANGAVPTVVNKNAGSPVRIDADRSKTTGKGGDDIQVEVNTELLPTPHIRVSINRITSPLDATDLQVLVAFPFQAFNNEPTLPSPNLFIGYQTHAVGGSQGGIAPLREEFRILPGTLAGTSHDFILRMETVGSVNPMTFIAGHFDGTAASGIENALGMQAYVEPVPASIEVGFDLDQSAITSPGSQSGSTVGFTWDATSQAYVEFTYFENESFPIVGDTNYGTTLSFNMMPTQEDLSIVYDNSAGTGGTLSILHSANAVVGEIELAYHRSDGLTIVGTLTDVPTSMAIGVDFAGSATLDVNNNLGSLVVQVTQEGGFLDTTDFLGYNLGYAEFGVADAPSLTAGYDAANNSFGVAVVAPGTDIGAVWLIIGDDHDLELPPSWGDVPTHHIFSLFDDGTHGTAAARVVNLIQATLYLDASPTGETFAFELRDDAPMQLYLETTVDSALTGEDIKVTCDIDNMPYGEVDFTIDFPDQFAVNAEPIPGYPETNDAASFVIDEISCIGNVGNLNFDLSVGQLPMGSGYKFDANGKLEVTVEPGGLANSAYIGHIRLRLWNAVEPLPSPFSLAPLVSTPLHDARLRVDQIPSFVGTWSDGAATAVNFKAGSPPSNTLFIGGVQVLVSTVVELTTPLEVANPLADDFLTFADLGAGQPKRLGAGVFGLNEFSYNSTDGAGQMSMSYKANAAHKLIIDVDSRFGGDFFPDYDIDLTFTLDAIPAEFSMTAEFNPLITYNGSAGIDSIVLDGYVDNSAGDGTADRTHVVISATSLPSQLALNIDPATGATLGSNDPDTMNLSLSLDSNVSIFGTPYQLVSAAMTGIPAKFVADWSGSDFLIEFKDRDDNPAPLATLTALVSTSNNAGTNAGKIAPYEADGPMLAGVITGGDSGCRVNYSPFLQEVDKRYHDAGSPSVAARLDALHCGSEQLDPGEDHVIVNVLGGAVDFASLKFSGFQKVSWAPSAGGGVFALRVPVPGVHPLFGGVQLDSNYVTLQIEDVPDVVDVVINTGGGVITYDASGSAGEIDVYYGPLPIASDADTAMRAVMVDTPSFVHITWGFGFPSGAVNFDASNEFEILFLSQDSGNRIAAGLEMEDLQIGYNVEFLTFNVADTLDITVPVPCFDIPPICEETLLAVPVAWDLVRATAGIDNDADSPAIGANPAKPGVDGFFTLYKKLGSPAALDTGTLPGGPEFVPLLTFQVKDFRELSMSVAITLDPLTPNLIIPFSLDVTGPTLVGDFVFDFWSSANTNEVFTIPLFDFDVGIVNAPDYTDNTPIHLIPLNTIDIFNHYDLVFGFNGFHGFGDHVDPFAP